jgi:hypothetical protein
MLQEISDSTNKYSITITKNKLNENKIVAFSGIENYECFIGKIRSERTKYFLMNILHDNIFIIRVSSTDNAIYIVSYKSKNKINDIRFGRDPNTGIYFRIDNKELFYSIDDIIKKIILPMGLNPLIINMMNKELLLMKKVYSFIYSYVKNSHIFSVDSPLNNNSLFNFYMTILNDPKYFIKVHNMLLPIKRKCINIDNSGLPTLKAISIATSHKMRKKKLIYKNILPYKLPNNPSGKSYYCYSFFNNNMVFGKINNKLEFGTSHQMLVDNENDLCSVAGEIEIYNNKGNIELRFNFESGTYGLPYKIVNHNDPMLKNNLIFIITKFFQIKYDGDIGINKIQYTDDILFEKNIPPQREELDEICANPVTNEALFKIPTDKCEYGGHNNHIQYQTHINLLCKPNKKY